MLNDDIKYKGIRDVRNLFDLSIDEDYYKPIRTNDAFNNNYIEYESIGDKDKTLTIKEYRDMIGPYLSDKINDHKTQGEWKIQLTITINFISSKDSDETRIMHIKNLITEIMMGSETDEIIEELFESLLQGHQKGLEESMRRSEFVFDSVDLLYYELHKSSLNRGGSYIDSPKWLKNKKETINPKNNDKKCFQYPVTVALNHEQIKSHLEKISNFPSHKKDRKRFESNNKSIALNILYVPYNTKKIRHAYRSKYNFNCENLVILLMIADGKKLHYLAANKLSALLRGITSKHEGDFYCF